MNDTEQSEIIVFLKIKEVVTSVLHEDFIKRYPAENEEFERESLKLYEAGPSGFVERYDALLNRYLDLLGYKPRRQHLEQAVGAALEREKKEMDMYARCEGRKTLFLEYGQHPILTKGSN